ncbi:uncharacterized protein [Panulirus ornatus]|uniref:uncharacterized protein n=1 Tax=Panulirus ornatus TaxID=150431 RepID=UPI003A8BCDD2
MASSSIEVMGVGGGEMKVMLMDDSTAEGDMEGQMQTIITATNAQGQMVSAVEPQPASSQEEDFPSMESQFHTLEGMEPPPGTIIFSPQDLLRPMKPVGRSRGRGGARSSLASIKQEPGGPSTFGGSQTLEMPVSCEVCGKVMMTGKTLVQHMAIHSDLKPFQCPHCPKSFARKVHLQGHLVVHGIEKQFECPICHQRFSRQDCVKVHMRLHDKSKCVYCDVCHKAFLTVGALNIHLRIHRGEKPFKCHLCSKCFTQKNHLITHIKRHTKVTDEHFTKKLGPRMFKCEHCPRSFIRLSDYERHVQWNHGAVAEGSIIDKLPTVGNLLDGELKQTGLAPQIFKAPKDALNSKPKSRRTKKVMCTTSTQTDEEGGHVIIPRQYQGQVCVSTQVSAPPTPRPADDDMYENDIFDEGMDRNYSSDEEEDDEDQERREGDEQIERKVFAIPESAEMASDPIQDAAFDAIVQGNTKPPQEQEPVQDEHSVFLQEVASSIAKQGLVTKSPDTRLEQRVNEEEISVRENASSEKEHQESIVQESSLEGRTVTRELEDESHEVPEMNSTRQVTRGGDEDQELEIGNQLMDIQTLKSRSETIHMPIRRPRGRGKKCSPYGLSGAAELRAIRKSMMKNILNAEPEEPKNMNVPGTEEPKTVEAEPDEARNTAGIPEDGETEGRGKRMAKNKQHGKDFVCNMKSCETCFSSPKPNVKAQTKVKVKVKEKESSEKPEVAAPVRKVVPLSSREPVKQVLKDITKQPEKRVPSIANAMHNMVSSVNKSQERVIKKMKVENRLEETKMKVGNRVGSYPVDITANPLHSKTKKEDYFVTTSNSSSVVSPPVELMSFCIPTYSCKLCSREFRFEGKLHRHIESVHQNKSIFSPDVKPGRGSSKIVPTPSQEQIAPHPSPPLEPENPEIAALRSEWDDDDDDDDDDVMEAAAVSVSAPITSFAGPTPTLKIVTREIAPVTTTVTDVYSSGVKVNMNKLAGLLPQAGKTIPVDYEGSKVKNELNTPVCSTIEPSHPREPETIMADTLDMKCRRLLEKLFDHDLLLSCGLLEEHVSVVLGRVLQHYGVKMIEDYGQGQYEVLKYNLWRLIEWKVTMEQMEEFYTAGKSVEEMMDDIMNEQVPLVSHHFVPQQQAAQGHVQANQAAQVTQVEAVDVGDGQMVLQHVAGVLGGQINLPEGVTQVVLSQDVPPDLLQGAHIVTIDPTTGQVISQVTADQVILADSIGDELEQQVAALDGQVVVSQSHVVNQNVSQGNIVVTHSSAMPVEVSQAQISHGQVIVQAAPPQQAVKMETMTSTPGHPTHQHQQ